MTATKPPSARSRIPPDFGVLLRHARKARGWTQARLAAKVGVARETVARLEAGQRMPGEHLIRALLRDDVIADQLPLPDLKLDETEAVDRGHRAAVARRTAGVTLAEAALAAGISVASLSLFERSRAAPKALVGPAKRDDGREVVNDGYAKALGFDDAEDMSHYLMSADPQAWLRRLAMARRRPLPPPARLPA